MAYLLKLVDLSMAMLVITRGYLLFSEDVLKQQPWHFWILYIYIYISYDIYMASTTHFYFSSQGFFFFFGWLSHRSQELCTAMETSGGGLIAILASEVPCSDRKTGGFTCDKNDDIVIKQWWNGKHIYIYIYHIYIYIYIYNIYIYIWNFRWT